MISIQDVKYFLQDVSSTFFKMSLSSIMCTPGLASFVPRHSVTAHAKKGRGKPGDY